MTKMIYDQGELGTETVKEAALTDGTTNYTTNAAADVIAAPGATVKIAVTSILASNGHATQGTKVSIRNGTTVVYTGFLAALGGQISLVAGDVPLFIGALNAPITAICGTTGVDVDVTVAGFTITEND